MKKRLFIPALATFLFSAGPIASADTDAEPFGGPAVSAGHHRHDGFYLRFMLGPSAVAASANDAAETKVSGTGGALGIALGYSISPNVVLYGEVFDNVALSPTIEQGATETETSDDTAFGLVGIGPGIAVYLPHNFYLSSTVAFARLVVDPDTGEDDDEGRTDLGVAVTAAVGKEWWVSSNWGLGVALQLYGGAMKDGDAENEDGDDLTWAAGGALLAFSATLN
jgi:hypothetical protein